MSLNAAQPIREIVVVGGGTAGWMTAAALAKRLAAGRRITLVESDEIGIIGVGEATVPTIRHFNAALGIDEDEFLRATQGTFKLGIEFVDWGAIGRRYTHGFGALGFDLDEVAFHHWWLRLRAEGRAPELRDCAVHTAAPPQGRFTRGGAEFAGSPIEQVAHAFHFDAGLYARFLRRYAEARGVRRVEGKIVDVRQREPDGHIASLRLDNGAEVAGQLFIDCSGLRGLLIEQTLKAGYVDWTHWLPCDRAVAVPCESAGLLMPLTRSTARKAGWQWRIPLQHRIGNGHVYSSRHLSDDEATAVLMQNLDGAALAEPRLIRFATGRRRRQWIGNVVAIGLSSGFLEPLESTSIHLIQTGIARLFAFFPDAGFDAADIDEFNAQSRREFEHVRDFIIAHYHLNARTDSPFWTERRETAVPEALAQRLALFARNARVFREGHEYFGEPSWVQVLLGQGFMPAGWHALANERPLAEVQAFVDETRALVARCVQRMPLQADFIARHCRA
jgi:tryptophan 7-halogenase